MGMQSPPHIVNTYTVLKVSEAARSISHYKGAARPVIVYLGIIRLNGTSGMYCKVKSSFIGIIKRPKVNKHI